MDQDVEVSRHLAPSLRTDCDAEPANALTRPTAQFAGPLPLGTVQGDNVDVHLFEYLRQHQGGERRPLVLLGTGAGFRICLVHSAKASPPPSPITQAANSCMLRTNARAASDAPRIRVTQNRCISQLLRLRGDRL